MDDRMRVAISIICHLWAIQAGESGFDNSNFKSYEQIPSVSNYNRNPFPFGNGIFWSNHAHCDRSAKFCMNILHIDIDPFDVSRITEKRMRRNFIKLCIFFYISINPSFGWLCANIYAPLGGKKDNTLSIFYKMLTCTGVGMLVFC